MKPAAILACIFGVISLIAFILYAADKRRAIEKKWRIPEKVLMLFGFFGGATVMYITMQIIRHKTQHKKFMIGLPVMIVVHLVLLVMVFYM